MARSKKTTSSRAPWTSEELELLCRALANQARRCPAKLTSKVYPELLALGGGQRRTRGAIETASRSVLKARRFVLIRRSWSAWLALSEARRLELARKCPSMYRGILLHMSEEAFRLLDQVAARSGESSNSVAEPSNGAQQRGSDVRGSEPRSGTGEHPVRAAEKAKDGELHDAVVQRVVAAATRTMKEMHSRAVEAHKHQRKLVNGILDDATATKGQREIGARFDLLLTKSAIALRELGQVVENQIKENARLS